MVQTTDKSPFSSIDWFIVLLYLLLVTAGWFSICGASYDYGNLDFFSFDTRTGKQLVWIICSLFLGFFILMFDKKIYEGISYLSYFLMMGLLLITPFLATNVKGSYSWIKLGSISLQPAEFAKCATALALSKYMGQFSFSMEKRKDALIAITFILLPMTLIILQKETGSALVYLAFFLVFYREGLAGSILFTGIAAILYFVVGMRFAETPFFQTPCSIGEVVVLLLIYVFTLGMVQVYTPSSPKLKKVFWISLIIIFVTTSISVFIYPFNFSWIYLFICIFLALYIGIQFIVSKLSNYFFISLFTLGSLAFFYSSDYVLNNVLEPHQQIRVKVLLGLAHDPHGAGYNVNQSMIAIGSGGLKGKGFLNGTQTKLKYVPEQDTDFIFCTIGEEEGFIGSTIVLLLFMTLILRIIYLAERQRDSFTRIYGYCVASILFFHLFINIGMVLGLTPVIGIPLPFFSYGGSSLWGFTLLLFIFLRLDINNKQRLLY